LPKGKTLLFPLEEGSNGVFLAKQGFEVTGIDYSDSALRAAQKLARENEVRLGTVNADLESHDFGVDRYDLIVGLDFYRPRLVEQIKRALKKNGVLLYTVGVATPEQIQKGAVPAHSLRPGELRTLFADFQVIVYDEIPSGPDTPGQQPLARLIARKP
jgi:SAM-dependent methyltransferase